MTIIYSSYNLSKDGNLALLGQLIIMIVKIVHQSHLHQVRHNTNVFLIHEISMKLKNICMLHRLKNGRFSLCAVYLKLTHLRFVEHFDCKAFSRSALSDSLHGRCQTASNFVQNFILIFYRRVGDLKKSSI